MLTLHTAGAQAVAADWRMEPLSLLSFKQQEEQNANWCLQAFEHTVASSHPPLSFQVHWTSPILVLIILGHHRLVTSVFPPLDCEPMKAGLRLAPSVLSAAHGTHRGEHSANVHEIRNLKRGQEVIITEMCLTQIPLSGYTADWVDVHNTLQLTLSFQCLELRCCPRAGRSSTPFQAQFTSLQNGYQDTLSLCGQFGGRKPSGPGSKTSLCLPTLTPWTNEASPSGQLSSGGCLLFTGLLPLQPPFTPLAPPLHLLIAAQSKAVCPLVLQRLLPL